jgi:hypothetical protein
MLPWITALRVFNKGSPSWCVPRKGTVGYETVTRIRQGQEVKTPKQIIDDLERKSVGKSKTERKSATISLDAPKMTEPWTPFPDTPPASPKKPKRIRAKVAVEAPPKTEPPKKEGLAGDVRFRITIPKDADYDLTAKEEKKLDYYKHSQEHRADYVRFIKDFKRYGREVLNANNPKKATRNVSVYHSGKGDQVVISSGVHRYETGKTDFHPKDAKIYTLGKPLPKDPKG